jgi:hypothetical protein
MPEKSAYQLAREYAERAARSAGTAAGTTFATLAGAFAQLAEVDVMTDGGPLGQGLALRPTPESTIVADKMLLVDSGVVQLRLQVRVHSDGLVEVREDGAGPTDVFEPFYVPTERVFSASEVAALVGVEADEFALLLARVDEAADEVPEEGRRFLVDLDPEDAVDPEADPEGGEEPAAADVAEHQAPEPILDPITGAETVERDSVDETPAGAAPIDDEDDDDDEDEAFGVPVPPVEPALEALAKKASKKAKK